MLFYFEMLDEHEVRTPNKKNLQKKNFKKKKKKKKRKFYVRLYDRLKPYQRILAEW
jgi:hypothetical protein